MPVSIKIADGGQGIVLTAQGYLTIQEVSQANLDFFEQYAQEFLSCRYWLVDGSQIEATDGDFAQIHRLASIHIQASNVNPELVFAVYSTKDYVLGLARMWKMLAEATGWEIRIFRSAEDAKVWIRSSVNESLIFK